MDNVDQAQLAKAQALMTEKPTAKTAVKNYWMMVLASGLPGLDRAGEDQEVILRCAKKLLGKINAIKLKPPAEWGVEHPQADDETGIARMEAIANYKVFYSLWAAADKARAAGAKLTAMVGRTFLKEVWADHLAAAAATTSETESSRADRADSDEEEAAFMAGFESELFKDDADAAGGLVWSIDVDAVLADRAKQRKSQATDTAADAEAKVREVVEESMLPPVRSGGGGGGAAAACGGGGGGSGGGGGGGVLIRPKQEQRVVGRVYDLLAEIEGALVTHITSEYTATTRVGGGKDAPGLDPKVAAKASVMLSFREPIFAGGLRQSYENTLLWSDFGRPAIKQQEDALKLIIEDIKSSASAAASAGNTNAKLWVVALSQNLIARAGLLLDLDCIANSQ